jgi:hypothetical protein
LIDEGPHISYPYVLSHAGVIYTIPECSESKSILLYRLDELTGIWHRETVLIDGVDAVNTTVFQYDARPVGNRFWHEAVYTGRLRMTALAMAVGCASIATRN